MNRWLRVVSLLLLGLLAVPAAAQTLKIATLAPDGSAWMRELRAAAAEVKAGTAGRVEIKFYPGGVMGSDQVVLRKMRLGQLQGGVLTASELSLVYPDAPAYTLPFLFKDWAEVDRVRASVDPLLAKGFEEKGVHLLGIAGVGFAYLMGGKPLASHDDWPHLKLWVPQNDQIAARTFELAGVSTVPLSLGDVFTGLQTGMIDTVANTPSGAIALQWHGKVKHVVDLPLTFIVGYMALDDKAWRKLSPADQAVVDKAFHAAAARMDASARRDDEAAMAALRKQGVQVASLGADEAKYWRDLGTRVTTEMTAGGKISPEIVAAIRKAQAAGGSH